MAATKNLGQIDRDLLHRLYWQEEKSLMEVAAVFGVSHKSIHYWMDKFGIPRRKRGVSGETTCIDCGIAKVSKLRNGQLARCKSCKQKVVNERVRVKLKNNPAARARRTQSYMKWKRNGAQNPKGESGWIHKGRVLFKKVKKLSRAMSAPAPSKSPSVESAPAQTSPMSCRL